MPCPHLKPEGAVKLEFAAQKGILVGKKLPSLVDDPDQAVEIENGEAGVYNVLAELDFKRNSSWMSSASLTVYAPKSTEIITHTSAPKELAIEMLGPNCKVASLPNIGLVEVDMETTMGHGIPTYWTADRERFVYYVRDVDQWYAAEKKHIGTILQGTRIYYHQFHKGDFKCGCHDSERGVEGFSVALPCDRVTNSNFIFDNVKCDGVQYSSVVQSVCPVTCGVCPGSNGHSSHRSAHRRPTSSNKEDCGRVGGSSRKHFTWGGSCKCDKGKVLKGDCPERDDFKAGDRYYSKTALGGLSDFDLRLCRCG